MILNVLLALVVFFLLSSQIKQFFISNFYKVSASRSYQYATVLNNFTPIADTGTIANMDWAYVVNPTTTDWVGLYSSGSADTAPLARFYTSWTTTKSICPTTPGATAQSSGGCIFPIPLNIAAGSYEFRLFSNNSYTKLASTTISITSPNLTVSPTNVISGGTTNFSWHNQARSSYTNWVGFFAKGAPNSQKIDWDYVSCAKIPTTDIRNGTCAFTIPPYVTSGTYEFRFFDDVYGQTGTSNPITVTGSTTPLPTPTQAPDTAGPIVTITYPPSNTGSIATHIDQPLAAVATDPTSGVAKVEFYVDGNLICTDTTSPYACDWRVSGKHGAYYTIQVKGYDTLGNSSKASITVYAW